MEFTKVAARGRSHSSTKTDPDAEGIRSSWMVAESHKEQRIRDLKCVRFRGLKGMRRS